MYKRQVLQGQYSQFLTLRGFKNGEACLFQLKEVIKRFLQNHQQNSLNLKFLPSHLQFLFQSISKLNEPFNQQFIITLQVLNYLLRSPVHCKLKIPIYLLHSLSAKLALNQDHKNSKNVIANVVWLICRCLQVIKDREVFMHSVSESGILEHCVESQSIEKQAQKGVALLLNYMCKREIEQDQIYLTLLRNIQKFSQVQIQSQQQSLINHLIKSVIPGSTQKCFSIICKQRTSSIVLHFLKSQFDSFGCQIQKLRLLTTQNLKSIAILAQIYPHKCRKVLFEKGLQAILDAIPKIGKDRLLSQFGFINILFQPHIEKNLYLVSLKSYLHTILRYSQRQLPQKARNAVLSLLGGQQSSQIYDLYEKNFRQARSQQFLQLQTQTIGLRSLSQKDEVQLDSELLELFQELTGHQQNLLAD